MPCEALNFHLVSIECKPPETCKIRVGEYETKGKFPVIEFDVVGDWMRGQKVFYGFSSVISFWAMMDIWERSGIGKKPYSLCFAKALWAKRDYEMEKIEESQMLASNLTAIQVCISLFFGVKFDFFADEKPVAFDCFDPVSNWFPPYTDAVFLKGFLK